MNAPTPNVLDAFESSNAIQEATETIQELAEEITLGSDELARLKQQASDVENRMKQGQQELYHLLASAGLTDFKCPNGLWPHAKINIKYFKAKGVQDGTLFEWLTDNGLDGIIKPTVHWGTLSSTMKEFVDAGNEVPEIINRVEELTISMTGKAKWLKGEGHTDL